MQKKRKKSQTHMCDNHLQNEDFLNLNIFPECKNSVQTKETNSLVPEINAPEMAPAKIPQNTMETKANLSKKPKKSVSFPQQQNNPICIDVSTQKDKNSPSLPSGWKLITRKRKNGVTKGKVDRYWVSPEGIKYNSMVKVKKALKKKLNK